jgi:hypothetical protein
MTKRLVIAARVLPDGLPFKVVGRRAWALRHLVNAGKSGCTSIEHSGPRWSAYVHKLRTLHGLSIETIDERHGGQFAGSHARYVLRSEVEIIEDSGTDRRVA